MPTRQLVESLHTAIDATAEQMHRRVDEILQRHAAVLPSPARICVDPGHGGRDPGATAGGVEEKYLTLQYSLGLRRALEARGHDVLLTREEDTDLAPAHDDWGLGKGVDLRARSQLANEFGAECFVSIHANAAASSRAEGAWVIHNQGSQRGEALARAIFRRLATVPGIPDQDEDEEVYADNTPWVGGRQLSVLGRTRMPAVIVELGFLTNPGDLAQLQQPRTRKRVSAAIADGIGDWLRSEE